MWVNKPGSELSHHGTGARRLFDCGRGSAGRCENQQHVESNSQDLWIGVLRDLLIAS